MAVIQANPGMFAYRGPRGRGGGFRPTGKLVFVGTLPNPKAWEAVGGTLAARLFVGFNVGDAPTWKLDDVVKIVREVRRRKPDASFVLQKGLYRHKAGERRLVEEEGAQVIIVDVWRTKPAAWERQMVRLAETLARRLRQEEVVVEIQRAGITQKVIGVTA